MFRHYRRVNTKRTSRVVYIEFDSRAKALESMNKIGKGYVTFNEEK